MKYFLVICSLFISTSLWADSKRIEVFPVSQAYWDIKTGETLGEICKQLLPNTPAMHTKLITEIVQLNPHAFPSNNPDIMKAKVRLWLPGHFSGLHKAVDKTKYKIREFNWGYIQQRR